tara:strand:- start:432 stop:1325 length:894 start_codon:yes stop_codon:yes gene_type:complete
MDASIPSELKWGTIMFTLNAYVVQQENSASIQNERDLKVLSKLMGKVPGADRPSVLEKAEKTLNAWARMQANAEMVVHLEEQMERLNRKATSQAVINDLKKTWGELVKARDATKVLSDSFTHTWDVLMMVLMPRETRLSVITELFGSAVGRIVNLLWECVPIDGKWDNDGNGDLYRIIDEDGLDEVSGQLSLITEHLTWFKKPVPSVYTDFRETVAEMVTCIEYILNQFIDLTEKNQSKVSMITLITSVEKLAKEVRSYETALKNGSSTLAECLDAKISIIPNIYWVMKTVGAQNFP